MSTFGKDWREKVVHYERRVVEHGIDAVKTGYKGHAADPDLLSGSSRNVAELSDAVINAINCTVEAGSYVIKTGTSHSNVWGLYIANVILKNSEIVKVLLDRISLRGEDSKEKYGREARRRHSY